MKIWSFYKDEEAFEVRNQNLLNHRRNRNRFLHNGVNLLKINQSKDHLKVKIVGDQLIYMIKTFKIREEVEE